MGEGTRSFVSINEIEGLGREGEEGAKPCKRVSNSHVWSGREGNLWLEREEQRNGVNMKRKKGNEEVFNSTKKLSGSEVIHPILLKELEDERAELLTGLCNILLKISLLLVSEKAGNYFNCYKYSGKL